MRWLFPGLSPESPSANIYRAFTEYPELCAGLRVERCPLGPCALGERLRAQQGVGHPGRGSTGVGLESVGRGKREGAPEGKGLRLTSARSSRAPRAPELAVRAHAEAGSVPSSRRTLLKPFSLAYKPAVASAAFRIKCKLLTVAPRVPQGTGPCRPSILVPSVDALLVREHSQSIS